jgi:outer membrane lipoprotein-sorting protein
MMVCRKSMCHFGLMLASSLAASLLGGAAVVGQDASAGSRTDRESLPKPIYKVANKVDAEPAAPEAQGQGNQPPAAAAHPLQPAIDMAYKALATIQNNVKDYSCTLSKRERIDGTLQPTEELFIKVRHEPFSVYTYFKGPENMKGQEALYVAGKNDGCLLGHGVGIKKVVGTLALKPDSMLAMRGNRYPITEIGVLNLTKRLIEVAELDKKYGECEVKFYNGAKIDGRPCTCIMVTHPVPRKNFRFNVAKVYVDAQYGFPIRYEAYDWPAKEGGPPLLLEEYTYRYMKINNGFTDADFDDHNPDYGFH